MVNLIIDNKNTSWKYGVLEDAIEKGSSNISLNKVRNDTGDYPLYSAKGFNKKISFFHQHKVYLAIIKDGAGIGRVSKHPAKSSIVATMQYLIPKDGFNIDFIKYFLNGIDFEKHRNGSTIPHIYFKDYKSERFPILPLPEQKRIVSILDRAFEAIDQAKANAEQNLKNAKELFESYLQGVFENKGDDWEEKEFGEVITILTDYHANGSYKILKKNVMLKDTEDYAWMIRSTDFEKKFKNSLKYIDKHAYNFMSKSKVFGNEIIMSKIGNAGIVYLMPRIDRPVSLAMNLFLIRLNENIVSPDFIFRFLKSNGGETQIKKRVKGATTKTITKDNVRNIIISYPPVKTQKQIVDQLDKLQAETKKLEAIYQQKIDDLEELKKSVLQKAFSGQLIMENE